jgi:hypothetical protein
MSFVVITAILILIVVTVYIILHYVYPASYNNDVLSAITPLNVKKDIVMPDVAQSTLLGTNGATVMGLFKFMNGDRTAKYNSNYTPFLFIANNWYMEISNAPNDKQHSAARLRVKTKQLGQAQQEEIIDLPPIPKQKWVFIAVLREGRRFDIIYDSKIVASQRLESYPAVVSSPMSIGNKGLDGSAIHVIINGTRSTPSDVERTRLSLVDTNNTVPEENPMIASLPSMIIPNFSLLLPQCPSGFPCNPATKPPPNQLYQWNTPYA